MSEVLKRELRKVKKMIHPNSRKSIAIAKRSKKICNRTEAKQAGLTKQALVTKKMVWMRENMVSDVCPYTPELTAELLEKYLARHDEELSLIAEKNNVVGKRNKSHASRADVLRMSKEREREEYENAGIEIPNILIAAQCTMLKKWDGDVRYLPNFVFRRFGKKHLNQVLQRNAKVQKIAAYPSEETPPPPPPPPPPPLVPERLVTTTMDTE